MGITTLIDPLFSALKRSNKSVVFRDLAVNFQPEISVPDARKTAITQEAQALFGELGRFASVNSSNRLVIDSLEKPGQKPILWSDVFSDTVSPDAMFIKLRESGALTDNEIKNIEADFNTNLTKPGSTLGDMSTDGFFLTRQKRTAQSKAKAAERYGNFQTKEGQDLMTADMAKYKLKRDKMLIKTSYVLGVMLTGGFAALAAFAAKKNGCWLIDVATEKRIVKVSGDENMCTCGGMEPELQENVTLKEHAAVCDNACTRADNPGVQTDWANCQDSCFCMDADGKMNAQQFRYEWVNMDAWDALGNLTAQYVDGGIDGIGDVKDKLNDWINVVKDQVLAVAGGVSGFIDFIKKWWWLPVVIVFVVVGAVLAIKYIPASKNKTRDRVEGGGGGGSTRRRLFKTRSSPRSLLYAGGHKSGVDISSLSTTCSFVPMSYEGHYA